MTISCGYVHRTMFADENFCRTFIVCRAQAFYAKGLNYGLVKISLSCHLSVPPTKRLYRDPLVPAATPRILPHPRELLLQVLSLRLSGDPLQKLASRSAVTSFRVEEKVGRERTEGYYNWGRPAVKMSILGWIPSAFLSFSSGIFSSQPSRSFSISLP